MMSWFAQRLQPPVAAPVTTRDLPLEGLRGVCAALVVYAHLFLPIRVLDPAWSPSPRFSWFNLGYAAVLFFFVLSGYVIGLVTTTPATGPEIGRYVRHRAGRLLPLNTVAVIVCALLLAGPTWQVVTGNFLLLQNDETYPLLGGIPVLENNPNLWSLNYEVVFYLGFIALWWRRPQVGWILGLLLALVIAHAAGLPVPRLFARYACGGLFWLTGLIVAWLTPPVGPEDRSTAWPAASLIAYAIWTFAPLRTALLELHVFNWVWPGPTPVSPHRADFLPAALWLLLAVTGRAPRLQRIAGGLCVALALAGAASRLWVREWREVDTVAALALAAGGFLFHRPFSLRPLAWLAPLGTVSFGLYIIAAPLQLGQRALFPGFAGSGLTFAVRLVAVVLVVAGAAWLLEQRIAPPLGRWIRRLGGAAAP